MRGKKFEKEGLSIEKKSTDLQPNLSFGYLDYHNKNRTLGLGTCADIAGKKHFRERGTAEPREVHRRLGGPQMSRGPPRTFLNY